VSSNEVDFKILYPHHELKTNKYQSNSITLAFLLSRSQEKKTAATLAWIMFFSQPTVAF
jgi:hypothetical protein